MKAKDIFGRQFGEWTVLGKSDKPGRAKCQCSCGAIKDVLRGTLLSGKSNGCKKCANAKLGRQRSESFLAKQKERYIGQTINGWEIVDVYKNPEAKNNDLFCVAVCPNCKRENKMRLIHVKKTKKCIKCTNNLENSAATINKITNVDGSSLISVKARMNGVVNCNSTTGYNGVFKDGNKYRAAIFFKGKRIYLGSHDTLEEAISARKKADELLYGSYLAEHEGWEEELKQAIAEIHKK